MKGRVRELLSPGNKWELVGIIRSFLEKNVVFKIIGGGSNTMIRDDLEIPLVETSQLDELEFDGNHIVVQSGAKLSRIVSEASAKGLSGLEFASGIPGTIGGAVFMNSGAFGGEVSNCVETVEVMDRNGHVKTMVPSELDFSYRHSIFHRESHWILGCVLKLSYSTPEKVKEKSRKFLESKRTSQPLNMPSVGCIFKNPDGDYAARLIDESGLKGYRIGGVEVSKKHAGFFVNIGGATFDDFRRMYEEVSGKVKERFGVELEPEITIVW